MNSFGWEWLKGMVEFLGARTPCEVVSLAASTTSDLDAENYNTELQLQEDSFEYDLRIVLMTNTFLSKNYPYLFFSVPLLSTGCLA
jgi:hypothetical protein